MSRWALAVALAMVCACGSASDDPGAGSSDEGNDNNTEVLPPDDADGDGDGLCDTTEDDLGTDPDASDSDNDGLPDLEELTTGFDPTNAELPGVDQVVYLVAARDATATFPVRATVQGNGGSLSGFFEALPALDPDGLTAADFFRGGTAVAADPVDAVRSIYSDSARFGAVLGKTRLAFSLRFEYPSTRLAPEQVDCARAYPFRYAIKADNGSLRADGLYLLMLAPAGENAAEAAHCLPSHCQ